MLPARCPGRRGLVTRPLAEQAEPGPQTSKKGPQWEGQGVNCDRCSSYRAGHRALRAAWDVAGRLGTRMLGGARATHGALPCCCSLERWQGSRARVRPPQGQSPPVGEEAPVGVAGPVAAWGGAGGPLVLQRLPGERGAVDGALLLPPRGQRAAGRATVRGVLAADVAEPHAAWNWAPGARRAEVSTGERGRQGEPETPTPGGDPPGALPKCHRWCESWASGRRGRQEPCPHPPSRQEGQQPAALSGSQPRVPRLDLAGRVTSVELRCQLSCSKHGARGPGSRGSEVRPEPGSVGTAGPCPSTAPRGAVHGMTPMSVPALPRRKRVLWKEVPPRPPVTPVPGRLGETVPFAQLV